MSFFYKIFVNLLKLLSKANIFFTNHKYIVHTVITFITFVLGVIIPYFWFYQENIFLFNFISYTLMIFLCYQFFYSWHKIPQSLVSFILFYLNTIMLTFMLWALLNVMHGIKEPIFIENLSTSALVRYALFLFISITGIILFWSLKISKEPSLNTLYLKIKFPYLLEELLKIFRVFESTVFGPFFNWLLHQIYKNQIKQNILFTLHFLFCNVIPLITAVLFFNFAVFSGDLRLVLYCIPLTLMSWVFRVLWYYFILFINSNGKELLGVLTVTYEDQSIFNTEDSFVLIDKNLLNIQLKNSSSNSAYDALLLQEYRHLFILLGVIKYKISYYISLTQYVSLLILGLRIVSWCFILFVVFDYSNTDALNKQTKEMPIHEKDNIE